MMQGLDNLVWSDQTNNMAEISVYQAKTQFSKLLDRAVAGEDVVITRNGRPIARLVPTRRRNTPRTLGALRGKIKIAPDFDAPLPDDMLALFEGGT
jgi:prevent-host-death family protein